MALTAEQLNTVYQNVLFRPVDPAGIAYFANRTDISDAQVRQQIELSVEANTYVTPIVRLYQAALGRVPDVGGLQFFVGQLRDNGFDYTGIVNQFLGTPEYQARNGTSGGVTSQLVTNLYQDMLGRTPAQSEINYWLTKTPAQTLDGIANSPESANRNAAGVVTFLESAAVGTPNTGTLNDQVGPNSGTTFELTTGTDTFVGAATNDTFVATGATLNAFDSIDGGAGTDTLTVTNASGALTLNTNATISNVENVTIRNAGTTVTADVSKYTGLETVSVEQLSTANINGAVTVTTKANATSVSVTGGSTINITDNGTGTTAGTADTLSTVSINGGVSPTRTNLVTISSDALTTLNLTNETHDVRVNAAEGTRALAVKLDGVTGGSVRDDTATSLSLNVVNGNVPTFTVTTDAATALTLTGDKAISLTLNDTGGNAAKLATIDASAYTGGVTILSTLDVDTAFTGGSGSDTINIGAATKAIALGAGDDNIVVTGTLSAVTGTIDGGAGTDQLTVDGADYTTAGTSTVVNGQTVTTVTGLDVLNKVTGIETVEFTGSGDVALNGTTFANTGVTKFLFNGAGDDIITNAGSARTYAFGEANSGDASFTAKVGTTTINLSYEGGTTGDATTDSLAVTFNTGADPAGTAYTVNLASNGTAETGSNETGVITLTAGSTINITGAHALVVDSLANAETVNASTFTGALTLTGSAGNDTITVGTGGSNITAGGGADTINLGSGRDFVKFGTNDSGVVTDGVVGTIDTVTSFTVGTAATPGDQLQHVGTEAGSYTAITAGGQTTINNTTTTITAAATAAAADHTGIGWTAFSFQGSTYALYEVADSATYGTGDHLVKLVGVAVADLTAANFASVPGPALI
ncbi:hypothetical protein AEGHOMDF_0510 [Methylobacterium soli]|nr:hypothetical protein AEGHOMDF_0510 [Methylobacterium soli]